MHAGLVKIYYDSYMKGEQENGTKIIVHLRWKRSNPYL